ncbi:hypothetical protein CPB83DRAFT_861560 [Crepidotus variabilis]|uniref:ABM domain-containing protein n=1 Tax=Crepidotus variabilis TaxID=179855 RepID=A0A9P6E861_9AGAR|nr:hypothetical protein CPB83DRAFT_861560 [Crepidotus variabilis]
MTFSLVPETLAPEIIWWTPSSATLARPSDFREDAATWRDAGKETMVGTFHGAELDNQNSRVIVTVWKSLAHHQEFMSQEAYADLVLPLLEAMKGPYDVHQVIMKVPSLDLVYALSAPVTQFIYVTMRPGHGINDELVPLIEKLQKGLEGVAGCIASSWGPSTEKEALQIGIVGWRSILDRNYAVNGPLFGIVHRIRELSDVEIRYASLVSDTMI